MKIHQSTVGLYIAHFGSMFGIGDTHLSAIRDCIKHNFAYFKS